MAIKGGQVHKPACTSALILLGLFGAAGACAGIRLWATDNLGEYEAGTVGDRIITFAADDPSNVRVVGSTGVAGTTMSGLDFDRQGNLYAYGFDSRSLVNRGLYRIDAQTGRATLIGNGGVMAGRFITDLSFDPTTNTMYAVATRPTPGVMQQLYRIDLRTGRAHFVRDIAGTSQQTVLGLATDRWGERYLHDVNSDRMYAEESGPATPLGYEGLNTSFSHGMTIDWSRDNSWFHGAWNVGEHPDRAQLWRVDPNTGVGMLVGNIGRLGERYQTGDIAINPAPVPGALLLGGLGLSIVARLRRRFA